MPRINDNKENRARMTETLSTFNKKTLIKIAKSWNENKGCDWETTTADNIISLILDSMGL